MAKADGIEMTIALSPMVSMNGVIVMIMMLLLAMVTTMGSHLSVSPADFSIFVNFATSTSRPASKDNDKSSDAACIRSVKVQSAIDTSASMTSHTSLPFGKPRF